jgi:hypothetical protein
MTLIDKIKILKKYWTAVPYFHSDPVSREPEYGRKLYRDFVGGDSGG